MKRSELIESILKSDILRQWHWLGDHFAPLSKGEETDVVHSLLDTLVEIGFQLSDMPKRFITRIAGLSGRVGNTRQYEQLMQIMAEILILHRVVTYPWNDKVSFIPEPGGCNSHKTPDIHLQFPTLTMGIEVKSPSFLRHDSSHAQSCYAPEYTVFKSVENYLISASNKFADFKKGDDNYLSILFIVWDDKIEDPLTALLHPRHGIFSRRPCPYPLVDAVIISQQRAHIEALINNTISPLPLKHLLDYGEQGMEPQKIMVINPATKVAVPHNIRKCFDVI